MSTTDPVRKAVRTSWPVRVAVVVAVLLAGAAALAASGRTDTASGMLCGGGATLLVAAIVRRRALRAPTSAGSAGRLTAGRADERDEAILRGALAWVGIVAILGTTACSLAVALGADAQVALSVLLYGLLATGIVAFALLARRG